MFRGLQCRISGTVGLETKLGLSIVPGDGSNWCRGDGGRTLEQRCLIGDAMVPLADGWGCGMRKRAVRAWPGCNVSKRS